MKLSLAQLNTTPCDIAGNVERIAQAWDKAEQEGTDLVMTPEQSITGYPLEDKAKNPDVLAAAQKGLRTLIEKSKTMSSGIVVGLPEIEEGKIYNMIYVIEQGNILAKQRKHHLPNHDVFDEKRIYSTGGLPEPFEFRGHKLGLLNCEDGWHEDVARHLAQKGAESLLWVNASPYHVGKQQMRLDDVLSKRAQETGLPIAYVNQVGAVDEVVFDGYSCAMNADGSVAMQAPGFEESLQSLDLEFGPQGATFRNGEINKLDDQYSEIWQALVLGLKEYIGKTGFKDVVLGMSGGIDSAVVAALAADAIGSAHVHLVKLPSQYSSGHSKTDSDLAATMLGSPIEEIAIQPIVDALHTAVSPHFNANADPEALDIAEENEQARVRGNILMALSNANGWLLLSTGNKSEVSVGYCTLYGDMNGGFNPLKDVPKMLVYGLAEWRNQNYPKNMLGTNGPVIPENIIRKKPSAELRPGQFDEETLPPYPVLDDILKRYIEDEQSLQDIVRETGYKEELVAEMIKKTDIAEFKRRQACPGVKISERAFGKGYRVPIVGPSIPAMINAGRQLTL